jgi:hypothetical protein
MKVLIDVPVHLEHGILIRCYIWPRSVEKSRDKKAHPTDISMNKSRFLLWQSFSSTVFLNSLSFFLLCLSNSHNVLKRAFWNGGKLPERKIKRKTSCNIGATFYVWVKAFDRIPIIIDDVVCKYCNQKGHTNKGISSCPLHAQSKFKL